MGGQAQLFLWHLPCFNLLCKACVCYFPFCYRVFSPHHLLLWISLWKRNFDVCFQLKNDLFKHIDRKAVISRCHLSFYTHEIHCGWTEQLRSNFLATSFNRHARKCSNSHWRSYIKCNFCKWPLISASSFLLVWRNTFTSVSFQEISKGCFIRDWFCKIY